jgi:hypothetical protein
MRLLLSILCSFFTLAHTCAQPFSFLYFQGDKQLPFYVKLEGVMMPRYGGNHCILSELSAGTAHVEILFEQNKFPAQKFTVNVPENGFRGFMLHRGIDGFTLYDLQQKKYLPASGEL